MAEEPRAPRSNLEEIIRERSRRQWEAKMERRRTRWEARRARGFYVRTGRGAPFIGLILAGIGVLLLLQNLGIIAVDNIADYWPVILIVFGIARTLDSWGIWGRIWGGIIAGAGCLFLARNLGYIQTNLWNLFWPAILIAIGLGLLLRAFDRGDYGWAWDGWRHQGATSDESTLNGVKIDTAFSGTDRRMDTQQFDGGQINVAFGGVDLDLTQAAMKGDQVRIECNAAFGGIDIRVPETWLVMMRGTGIFGGFADETHPPPSSDSKTPTLLVTGSAVFGGVTVKN